MPNFSELLSKYDVPTPRYTSYPTVPYWDGALSAETWVEELKKSCSKPGAALALYLHLPFCENLCFFCGCNTVITKDHSNETSYLEYMLAELALYNEQVPALSSVLFHELHIGGGTPTFFSPANLSRLLSGIFEKLTRALTFTGSIEIDPRHFTAEQMDVLQGFGFKRVSLGVQDFDPTVQKAVNRIQPFAMTKQAAEIARARGVTSVNFDLIYGLPYQTKETIKETIYKVIELLPDRIAFYSFAHVPWIKQAHQKLGEHAPVGSEKRELYEIGRGLLLDTGYIEIGMDHFALPSDALSKSLAAGVLHRNFMGYVEQGSEILLGLGVSSISSCSGAYSQNHKIFGEYQASIQKQKLPVKRGHVMTEDDQMCYAHIQNIMTAGKTVLDSSVALSQVRSRLSELEKDNLVAIADNSIQVTELGRAFLRNIAVAFDNRLHSAKPESIMFSKAI